MQTVLIVTTASGGGYASSNAWVLGVLYHVDDVVAHKDRLYICLRETDKQEPGHGPRFWKLYEVGP